MPVKAGDWRRSPISIATGRWVVLEENLFGSPTVFVPARPSPPGPIRRAMVALISQARSHGLNGVGVAGALLASLARLCRRHLFSGNHVTGTALVFSCRTPA